MTNKKNITRTRFLPFLDLIDTPTVVIDSKGKILAANSGVEKVIDYKLETIVGQNFVKLDVFNKKTKNVLIKNFMKRQTGKKIKSYKIEVITKKGKKKFLELSGKMFDYEKEKLGLYIFHDVTTSTSIQKVLKAKLTKHKINLQEEKNKLEGIFDASPDAIITVDMSKKIVECNPAAVDFFGFSSKEEMYNTNICSLIKTNELNRMKQIYELLSEKGILKNIELTALTKNGEAYTATFSGQVWRSSSGQPKGTVIIFKNITKRKKMEELVRQERIKLELITKNLGAGIIVVSKDYHINWANDFIKQSKGNVEKKWCYHSLNNSDCVCSDCGVKKIFEDNIDFDSHEYYFVDKQGKDSWVEIIATPIKDFKGNVIAALELTVDITEKKSLQSKLTGYSQKLEQIVEERTKQLVKTQSKLVKSERLAAIGELAAMVGHDIRNPLAAIRNATFYLKKKRLTLNHIKNLSMLEVIDDSVDHANRVVNDLLDYSREIRLEKSEASIYEVLKTALSMISVPKNVKIVDLTNADFKVEIDVGRFVRVFVNLITNAIDAMPDGGVLKIKTELKKAELKITFKDTGIGISDELKKKIFTPLVTTKAQGMGFGLAISKRLVEAHKGSIALKSTYGKGTEVSIKMPIETELKSGGEKIWVNPKESWLLTTT